MNKHLLDQLSPDEQPLAAQLHETAGKLQVSPAFEMELEKQLMEKYKTRTQPSGLRRFAPALGWALAAVGAVFLLNWTFRSLVPNLSVAQAETPTPQLTFADQVHAGNFCTGLLAVAHNFSVAVTNENKTTFLPVDTENTLTEVRSFAWSANGERLAVVGNITGNGHLYIIDPAGIEHGYLLSASEVGYLRDASWSSNGRQILLWSSQNMDTVYLLSALGHGLIEQKLDVQILGTPQFAPNGRHIVFYGANTIAAGLFLVTQEDLQQPILVTPSVEHASAFAWSPDGTQLAYFLVDRSLGEALLVAEDFNSGEKNVLATLPIPKGSGSSIPDIANLSWSSSGKFLSFEFGRGVENRAIYLAYADGSGLVKLADSGHAPAISADERCLAYISNKQVFLLDLSAVDLDVPPPPPLLLAELPVGRSVADFRLDKLQWQP